MLVRDAVDIKLRQEEATKLLEKLQWTIVEQGELVIIIRTNRYWYSIEKVSEGIIMRRSSSEYEVKNYYQYEVRDKRKTPITTRATDQGTGTMADLIIWLDNQNQLSIVYNALKPRPYYNCQGL